MGKRLPATKGEERYSMRKSGDKGIVLEGTMPTRFSTSGFFIPEDICS
jgi:hypothetical protein